MKLAKTLLLEIGTEEMPARFMVPAQVQLRKLLEQTLDELRLPHGTVRTMGTPRRLAALVADVAEHQTPIIREVRGPTRQAAFDAHGRPTEAAERFARAQGVAVSDLVIKATDKGEFVFAVKRDEGRPAIEVLAATLPHLIRQLSFPKTMRWEPSGLRFGRPIRWIVALLDEAIIPFEIAGVRSDRVTYGRRFTDGSSRGKPISLTTAALYESALELGRVIVDPARRRALLRSQVQAAAAECNGTALMPDELLEEVNFLVEEPVALLGSFDPRYLELPPELLVTVMMHHQRYFPIARAAPTEQPLQLLPFFVVVCNGAPSRPETVRRGNEKVITARFEDARFYFAEDRQQPLTAFVPRLADIVFQQGLGTMADKTQRLKALTAALCAQWGVDADTFALVQRAAELCKADLATRLVNEFTELQGVIGRIYALLDGEPPAVAWAIEDHYKPQPPDYTLPRHLVGWLLAVADRVDTLCACFDRDMVPTGSHDPLGLRRAATTLLVLLRHPPAQVKASLTALLALGLKTLADAGIAQSEPKEAQARLLAFLRERLEALLESEGIDHDLRGAVLAAGIDMVPAVFARADTLQKLRRARPHDFRTTVDTFTRVTNILMQARQRGESLDDTVQPALFQTEAESALYRAVEQVFPIVTERASAGDFAGVFSALAELAPTINRFFDEVLVMHEQPSIRRNRLALLHRVEQLLLHLADFRLVRQ
ncbi:Glycine--tRNA ligase beta subunit [bacterium HR17]|jgi:glycyl-tRNA synthetase beta chain|uniref:Glycine--tRNA ligase beta subunit n=1 Tax=Candidatus Fervidibacter japonicus TaxID=2035412 RepID=A0A2H5XDX4_9BACT|nr:Glycine--tRNA ligase beta subunit [bacterium HR17]